MTEPTYGSETSSSSSLLTSDAGVAIWIWFVASFGLLLLVIFGLLVWLFGRRRHTALSLKLGSKRASADKALVFQPPRRATAVRSPGSTTHYLRKSPSPTTPGTPALPPPPTHMPGSNGATSPTTPNGPNGPTLGELTPAPLSKELADAAATEKVKVPEEPAGETRLGDLHFKLRYEHEKSALVVSVVSCQQLPAREAGGCDPYVKLQLLPDKQHKVKTRVVRKTRCPVYDEDFTFYGLLPNQLATITLHFVVLSFDRYSRDEIIGEVVVALSSLQLHNSEPMALCREIQPRSLKMRSVGRGEVLVSLCWQPAACRLTVVLLKARNLPKMDVTGLADPYVKMYLLYNGQRIAKKKTHVKKRTLNPVFNESFVFEVPSAGGGAHACLDNVALELMVLDWDRVTKNEVIGRLELGSAGAGSARHHWREVQAAPRRQIADWHKLKE